MARKLVWETAFWSFSTAPEDAVLELPYGTLSYVPLVTPAEVEAADRDRIWVERIVGHTFGASRQAQGIEHMYKERISVGRRFNPGVASADDVSQPWSPTESIDNFLWERPNRTRLTDVEALAPNPLLLTSLDQPYWSAIDVRVGRLLEPTDFLSYTVQGDPAGFDEGSILYIWGWVRVLISRM